MNKSRRERLNKAGLLVGNAMTIVEQVKDEEQDSLDNIPENLQEGTRYQSLEDAVDILQDALSSMTEATEYLDKAQGV